VSVEWALLRRSRVGSFTIRRHHIDDRQGFLVFHLRSIWHVRSSAVTEHVGELDMLELRWSEDVGAPDIAPHQVA